MNIKLCNLLCFIGIFSFDAESRSLDVDTLKPGDFLVPVGGLTTTLVSPSVLSLLPFKQPHRSKAIWRQVALQVCIMRSEVIPLRVFFFFFAQRASSSAGRDLRCLRI